MDVDALKQRWDLEFTWQVDVVDMVICVADIRADVRDCSFHLRWICSVPQDIHACVLLFKYRSNQSNSQHLQLLSPFLTDHCPHHWQSGNHWEPLRDYCNIRHIRRSHLAFHFFAWKCIWSENLTGAIFFCVHLLEALSGSEFAPLCTEPLALFTKRSHSVAT